MKKLLLMFSLAVLCSLSANAQSQNNTPERLGYNAGYALGNYVRNLYVIPNIPPRSSFRMLKFFQNPNPVLQTDGTYSQVREFMIAEPGDVTTIIYNQVATNYAYESGIWDYYYQELLNFYLNTTNNDEKTYYSAAMIGFNQTIIGINPVDAPPFDNPN